MNTRALLLALVVALSATPAYAQSEPVVSNMRERLVEAVRYGSCLNAAGAVDMSRVWHLNNESVAVGDRVVRSSGESVVIDLPNGSMLVLHVGLSLSEERGRDLDLNLSLAALDGEVMVYWRETFQHRVYEQGLLKVVGDDVQIYCSGAAGADSVH